MQTQPVTIRNVLVFHFNLSKPRDVYATSIFFSFKFIEIIDKRSSVIPVK